FIGAKRREARQRQLGSTLCVCVGLNRRWPRTECDRCRQKNASGEQKLGCAQSRQEHGGTRSQQCARSTASAEWSENAFRFGDGIGVGYYPPELNHHDGTENRGPEVEHVQERSRC